MNTLIVYFQEIEFALHFSLLSPAVYVNEFEALWHSICI